MTPALCRERKKGSGAKRKEFAGDRVTGIFRRMSGGYGFVRPSGTTSSDRSGDIFVAANHAQDAASGDTVLVAISKKRDIRRPNPEGEVVEILERDTHQFVGTYFEAAGNGYVQTDGTMFSKPIYVGDPGAKNAQPNDKVVFEMVRFPSHFHDGEGVITEVLGRAERRGSIRYRSFANSICRANFLATRWKRRATKRKTSTSRLMGDST